MAISSSRAAGRQPLRRSFQVVARIVCFLNRIDVAGCCAPACRRRASQKKPTHLQQGVGLACRLKNRFLIDVAYPNLPCLKVSWPSQLQHAPPVPWVRWEEMPWITVEPKFISALLHQRNKWVDLKTISTPMTEGQDQNRQHLNKLPRDACPRPMAALAAYQRLGRRSSRGLARFTTKRLPPSSV